MSAGDVEALASFMGWTPYDHENDTGYLVIDEEGGLWLNDSDDEWNPFTSADADFQVLQRAREVWGDSVQWTRFVVAYGKAIESKSGSPAYLVPAAILSAVLLDHSVGDYSRAVLAVLRSMPEEGQK